MAVTTEPTKQELAAEAVYNALGYAISAYFKAIKPVEKANGFGALGDFSTAHFYSKLGEARFKVNKTYLKRGAKKTWKKADLPETPNDLVYSVQVLKAVRDGATNACNELVDSLNTYKTSDDVHYNTLTKTTSKQAITDAIAYMKRITKRADDALIASLVA